MATIHFRVPLKLVSLNPVLREHWAKRDERANGQQLVVAGQLNYERGRNPVRPPYDVTITRVMSPAAREFDDDNLAGACKAIRDAIAKVLGVDDGDTAKIQFSCKQRRDATNAVEVLIVGASS